MIEELKNWLKVQRGDMLALYEAMGNGSAYGAAKAMELVFIHIEYLERQNCEPIQECKKDNCDHLWVRVKCHDCGVDKQEVLATVQGATPRPDIQTKRILPTNECEKCKQLVFGGYDCPCFYKPEIQSNQSQVGADRCQHEEIVTGNAYSRSNPPMKCIICGEFYR